MRSKEHSHDLELSVRADVNASRGCLGSSCRHLDSTAFASRVFEQRWNPFTFTIEGHAPERPTPRRAAFMAAALEALDITAKSMRGDASADKSALLYLSCTA
jgi:hypothetical protein